MAHTIRFRFGSIDRPSSERPTVQEVHDGIENLDNKYIVRERKKLIEDEDPIPFKHKGASAEIRRLPDGTEYCHYTYFSDTEESALIRDGDDGEEEDIRLTVIICRVLYFEDGQFAYQTSNNLHRIWIPEFIDKVTDHEISADADFKNLPQETMERFYSSRDQVSRIRFSANGDEISGDLDGNSFISHMKNLIVQTGSQKYTKNGVSLNEVPQLQQLADDEEIHIAEVVGKNESGVNEEIFADGSVLLGWHSPVWGDENSSGKRDRIEGELIPYLQEIAEE